MFAQWGSMKQKLYCYVDETGQDTKGKWFLVAVVVLGCQRKELQNKLIKIEQQSGKLIAKWHSANHSKRKKYFDAIIKLPILKSALYYSIYENTVLFADLIALTTAKAIHSQNLGNYQAQIVVDGLRKNLEKQFAASLRKLGIKTLKIKGARDESDPFVRLADALAGLLRDYCEKKSWTNKYVKKLIKNKYVQEI